MFNLTIEETRSSKRNGLRRLALAPPVSIKDSPLKRVQATLNGFRAQERKRGLHLAALRKVTRKVTEGQRKG